MRDRWPGIHLSLSHQVDPRLREFERTLTTVLDAYIRPAVSGYLHRLDRSLAAEHLPAPWIMRSIGGLAPSPACAEAPLTLAMSGPAAAAHAIRDCVVRHAGPAATAIGIDIGGTSTDICLVAEGSVLAATALTLGALDIRVPSADIVSVAVGGGSILQMMGGLLRVGPHSAGSNPGPACFGRGGTAPTLTDAALLSGLLPDTLGDSLALDRTRARDAMMSGLAVRGDDVAVTALGAVKVAEAMIAEAVRRKAFARGIDPRNAVLVAAGGGGALHAAEIADRIGCRNVIVPPHAGVLAAGGLAQVGFCEETERPVELPLAPDAIATLCRHAADDAARLRETLQRWSGSRDGQPCGMNSTSAIRDRVTVWRSHTIRTRTMSRRWRRASMPCMSACAVTHSKPGAASSRCAASQHLRSMRLQPPLVPAKAGIQSHENWNSAFAGTNGPRCSHAHRCRPART